MLAWETPAIPQLAHTLVTRYADDDIGNLEKTLDKAEGLSEDPLQQLLIFVKLFDEEILEIIRQWMLTWRSRIMEKLERIIQKHPPTQEIDIQNLADMLLMIFEGAFVLSQKDNKIITQQLSHYHSYLSLLFKQQ